MSISKQENSYSNKAKHQELMSKIKNKLTTIVMRSFKMKLFMNLKRPIIKMCKHQTLVNSQITKKNKARKDPTTKYFEQQN